MSLFPNTHDQSWYQMECSVSSNTNENILAVIPSAKLNLPQQIKRQLQKKLL
jgi:hypothetical protein